MTNSRAEKGWLLLYKTAVLESDASKMERRVAQAQDAIRKRALELWYSDTAETAERQELQTALRFLRLLLTYGKPCDANEVESAGEAAQ
jgi:hypothetical protein